MLHLCSPFSRNFHNSHLKASWSINFKVERKYAYLCIFFLLFLAILCNFWILPFYVWHGYWEVVTVGSNRCLLLKLSIFSSCTLSFKASHFFTTNKKFRFLLHPLLPLPRHIVLAHKYLGIWNWKSNKLCAKTLLKK